MGSAHDPVLLQEVAPKQIGTTSIEIGTTSNMTMRAGYAREKSRSSLIAARALRFFGCRIFGGRSRYQLGVGGEHVLELGPYRRPVGTQRQRLLIVDDRVARVALGNECVRQVVVRIGVIRIDVERAAKIAYCVLDAIELCQRVPEVVERF